MPSKVEAAENNVKLAKEALKTSLLKWKPDETLAAMYYKKAADDFRAARKLKESNDCLTQAIIYYKKVNELYSAGKAYEMQSQNYKMLCETGPGASYAKKYFDLPSLKSYEQALQAAAECFNKNGNVDSTFHILNKGSSTIDNQISQMAFSNKTPDLNTISSFTEASVSLLKTATNALIPNNKTERAQDIAANFSNMGKILLRLYNLSQKEEILTRIIAILLERNHHHCVSSLENGIAPGKLGTYVTEIVMLYLCNDDFITAKRFWAAANNPNSVETQVTGLKSIEEAGVLCGAVQSNHGFGVMVNLIKFWDAVITAPSRGAPIAHPSVLFQ